MSGSYQGMSPLLSDTVVLPPPSGELQRTPDSQTLLRLAVEASWLKLLAQTLLQQQLPLQALMRSTVEASWLKLLPQTLLPSLQPRRIREQAQRTPRTAKNAKLIEQINRLRSV